MWLGFWPVKPPSEDSLRALWDGPGSRHGNRIVSYRGISALDRIRWISSAFPGRRTIQRGLRTSFSAVGAAFPSFRSPLHLVHVIRILSRTTFSRLRKARARGNATRGDLRKRKEEETSSEGEGTRLAPEVARSGVFIGRCERGRTGPEGQGMRRGEIFGRSEELFGGCQIGGMRQVRLPPSPKAALLLRCQIGLVCRSRPPRTLTPGPSPFPSHPPSQGEGNPRPLLIELFSLLLLFSLFSR